MKLTKILILCASLAMVSITSKAQASFDVFGSPRTVVLSTTGVKSGGSATAVTSNPVDVRSFYGIAKIDMMVTTNAGGGTLTATIETSDDQTNWTAVTYASASSTSIIYTNSTYGGGVTANNITATNTYLLPGTITTPTASTAGYATPYLSPNPFTNTSAVTVSAGGAFSIGFDTEAAKRYVHVIWTPGGSVTNYGAAAVLTGRAVVP